MEEEEDGGAIEEEEEDGREPYLCLVCNYNFGYKRVAANN